MDNNPVSTKNELRISHDNMEAFLKLMPPEDGTEYTMEMLMEELASKGVIEGIHSQELQRMIDHRIYGKECRIAEGTKAIEGEDGYYEFMFNQNSNRVPKILPDGSVDYFSINVITTVIEGQQIAVYHPYKEGVDGINVKGAPVNAKRCRDLPPIKGKGFTRSDDGKEYYADFDGKIDFVNDRLIVSPVYEIQGDADLHTGNIEFSGDVIIHGMVKTGMNIHASGTVTIDGIVEGASIEAGKDIVLKSGLVGNSQAVIKTSGSLFAKFVEYATLDVKGDINAEALMNCEVYCEHNVVIAGKRGKVIGGLLRAIGGVEVNTAGNNIEARTVIHVGCDPENFRRIKILERKIGMAKHNIEVIEEKIREIDYLNSQMEQLAKEGNANDPRKVSMLRMKIKETANVQADQLELDELHSLVDRAQGATVQVNGTVYPGCCIRIDELHFDVVAERDAVQFVKYTDKIRMEEIADAIRI